MAVPRNRTSNARKNSRRAHHAKVPLNLVTCKQCHQQRMTHHLCPHCGFYDGKAVISNAKKEK